MFAKQLKASETKCRVVQMTSKASHSDLFPFSYVYKVLSSQTPPSHYPVAILVPSPLSPSPSDGPGADCRPASDLPPPGPDRRCRRCSAWDAVTGTAAHLPSQHNIDYFLRFRQKKILARTENCLKHLNLAFWCHKNQCNTFSLNSCQHLWFSHPRRYKGGGGGVGWCDSSTCFQTKRRRANGKSRGSCPRWEPAIGGAFFPSKVNIWPRYEAKNANFSRNQHFPSFHF